MSSSGYTGRWRSYSAAISSNTAHRHRTRRRGRRRRGRPPPSQRPQPGQPRHARRPHPASLAPDGVPRMNARPANDQPARPADPRTGAMAKGRQADSARRRQRVITALRNAVSDGTEISVAGIARAASVTAPSFTGTATCSPASTPSKPPRQPPATATERPSPGHHCRPTCLPPGNAPPGSTAESGNSRNAYRKPSASKPGATPDSVPPPTSTPSTRRSSTSSSRPSTCVCNSRNKAKISPPRGPPTASSWPSSTPRLNTGDTPRVILAPHLSQPLTFLYQPLSCTNTRIQPPPQGSTPGEHRLVRLLQARRVRRCLR